MNKIRSPKKTYLRRVFVLAALVMAAVFVLSAPMADAKKKKLHVVRCAANPCVGTTGNDRLIGTDLGETILGFGGNDVYEGNGGGDDLGDGSVTSSDTYVFKGPDLGNSFVTDCGGSSDTVDLSSTSFRLLDNVTITRDNFSGACGGAASADDLTLSGPEGTVKIVDQYGVGKVEKIKFANGTLTF
jgi:Ca2+-binding RTX toxin-like protein